MDDTASEFKCFPRSPYHSNKSIARNSSPSWFFTLLNPSNRKNVASVSPQEDQVSNELQTGQTVSKEDYNRVLQERKSLNDQLYKKDEEINKLKNQVCRLTGELNWLLSDSNSAINLSHAQDETGSSSNNKERVVVTASESNVVNRDQNQEKAIQEEKTLPVRRVRQERDIIGARASPLPPLFSPIDSGGTVQKPPSSIEEYSPDSFTYLFEKVRKERQLIKAKEAGLESAAVQPITLARLPSNLCYTDIFHSLVAEGLITPQSPETDDSGLYSRTSYLQICEYHKGGRGHSTETCSLLRLQVRKLIRDRVIKVEPPNLVVVLNKSSVPKFGEWS